MILAAKPYIQYTIKERLMEVLHSFVCDLCDKKLLHDPAKGHIPLGWKMKEIYLKNLLLCRICSSPGQFNGGPSIRIQDLFEKKFGEKY